MEYKGRITVYSIVGCPHCIQAKSTLINLGLKYVDVSIDEYESVVHDELKSITKTNTVPQIFFNNTHIGGNIELQKLVSNKTKFNEILDKVQNENISDTFLKLPTDKLKKKNALKSDIGFICEPDEYAQLVKQMKNANLIGCHSKMGIIYKNSFVGKEFVSWVKDYKNLSEEESLEIGKNLIQKHFGHQIRKGKCENYSVFKNDDTIYRLLEDDDTDALNSGSFSDCKPKDPSELSEELRKMILVLYSKHLSEDGRKVNYEGIKNDPNFQSYIELTKELQRLNIEDATREEKLAFFINVYNALVIHANIVRGVPTNLFQRWRFFNTVRYIIGGHTYNLQEIENGVLRANRKGVAMLSKPFSSKDPRILIALNEPEPLIHFALVCGAKSCPPIKTYSSSEIMKQLKIAAESFLESDEAIIIIKDKFQVKLSQIFSWYQEDFGSNKVQVLKFIHDKMTDGNKKDDLTELLNNENSIKISYLTYDWSVNS